MLVVSDATPLNVLVRAELVFVVPRLFDHVLIPPAVADELNHARTPALVRAWVQSAPGWLEVRAPSLPVSGERKGLGERQAIALALEIRADLLLADDRAARRAAVAAGLGVLGTLGVIKEAADRSLLTLPDAIDRIRSAGLFVSPRMIELLLRTQDPPSTSG